MENQVSQVEETNKTVPADTGVTQYFASESPEEDTSTSVVEESEGEASTPEATNDDSGEQSEVSDNDMDDEDDEPNQKKTGKGFEKRIERFNRRIQERDAEIERWKALALAQNPTASQPKVEQVQAPVVPVQKPTLAHFNGNVEAYSEALSDWKFEQRQLAAKQAEAQQTFKQKMDAIKAANADFDEVLGDFTKKYAHVQADEMNKYIAESETGPELFYYLAQNHAEADRILSLPSIHRVAALGRLEAKLMDAGASKPVVKVSKAPKPISSEKGNAPVEKKISDPNLSQKEYRELRLSQRGRKY